MISNRLELQQMDVRHCLIVTAAILVCSACSADTPPKPAATIAETPNHLDQTTSAMKPTNITDAVTSDAALRLLSVEGVEGIAEGTCDTPAKVDGDTISCIIIYVSNDNPEFTSGLPAELSGIPVRIKKTDKLSIFEAN